ncbi:MAG: hypothetical protein HPY70_12785 [Firmicutes bacterium]|nr:hypothetical protein [Bacillota bacterium]
MKVLLATNIKTMDEGIKRLCGEGIEFAGEVYYSEAIPKAAEGVDTVVLSAVLPGEDDAVGMIYRLRCADKRIILLAGDKENGIVNTALAAGVYDILFDPVKPEDVVRLLRKPNKFADVAPMVMKNVKMKNGGRAYDTSALRSRPGTGHTRKVVTVAGPEASGKSFVLSNLAYTFAYKGINTALLDGDLGERSQWFYFNIPDEDKRYALKDMLESEEVSDPKREGAFFMGGRLRVYTAAPYDMRFNKININCGCGNLISVTDRLRFDGGMVLVDNDGDMDNEFTRFSVSMADTVLLVVRPCYDELQKSRWMLEQLKLNRVTLNKFLLVINGFVRNRGFSVRDIVRYLNESFACRVLIPADNISAYESMRFGRPAVSLEGCSEEMKEAFETLAGLITGMG